MKIQLTNDQLNRLIGNDREFEIQLKKCVVHEFSNKYLKTVVDNELISKLRNELINYIERGINAEGKVILDIDNIISRYSYTISDKIKKMLEHTIETSLTQCFENHKHWMMRDIDKKMTKLLDVEIEKRIAEGVNDRLKKALEG